MVWSVPDPTRAMPVAQTDRAAVRRVLMVMQVPAAASRHHGRQTARRMAVARTTHNPGEFK